MQHHSSCKKGFELVFVNKLYTEIKYIVSFSFCYITLVTTIENRKANSFKTNSITSLTNRHSKIYLLLKFCCLHMKKSDNKNGFIL